MINLLGVEIISSSSASLFLFVFEKNFIVMSQPSHLLVSCQMMEQIIRFKIYEKDSIYLSILSERHNNLKIIFKFIRLLIVIVSFCLLNHSRNASSPLLAPCEDIPKISIRFVSSESTGATGLLLEPFIGFRSNSYHLNLLWRTEQMPKCF